jgi:hypothetical protein
MHQSGIICANGVGWEKRTPKFKMNDKRRCQDGKGTLVSTIDDRPKKI